MTGEDVTVTGEDVTVTGEDVTVTGEDVTLTPKRRRGRPKKVLAPPQNYRRMTDFLTRKKSNMELGAGGGAVIGGGEGSRAPHNKPITSGPLREAVEICASVDLCNPEVGPASVAPMCEDQAEQYERDQGGVDLTVCMESDVETSMGVGMAWKTVLDEVFCNQSFKKYTHAGEVQSDQTELNTMAVRPVSSKQLKEKYYDNLLGKTKIGNQKKIPENNLTNYENVITALSATSKDLNTETLTKPDQNQHRQRNGGKNDVTARNFCSTDTS